MATTNKTESKKAAQKATRRQAARRPAQQQQQANSNYGWIPLMLVVLLLLAGAFLAGRAAKAAPKVTEAPAQPQNFCGQARDLGPWAPGGVGETFEVTCNETNCTGTHVQLWWPAGSHQRWEKKEISVFIPAGLSIEVQNGAGKGWEYPLGCSLAEIQSQIVADNGRRTTDTSFFGQVNIDDLIKTGLVIVRFDRRGQ